MEDEIRALLICLIDEICFSQSPSELTLYILEKYKDKYEFVKTYLSEVEKKL